MINIETIYKKNYSITHILPKKTRSQAPGTMRTKTYSEDLFSDHNFTSSSAAWSKSGFIYNEFGKTNIEAPSTKSSSGDVKDSPLYDYYKLKEQHLYFERSTNWRRDQDLKIFSKFFSFSEIESRVLFAARKFSMKYWMHE